MNNKEQLQNPWIEITPEMKVKVLKDDRDIVNSINAKYKNKNKCTDDLVCTTMWPEPFQGNPDAPVYLLNGNPGGDGRSEVDKILLSDPLFRELMIANLCHQSVFGYDVFLYNNILKIDNNGKVCLAKQMDSKSLSEKALKNNGVLDGSIWWKKRTEEIRNTIRKNPNLFVVEYFPYNSKESKGIDRSERLPSYDYSDYLIRKAMADNKLIVIMRWKAAWCKRIKELADYPNLLEISSDSSVFLSSGNLLPFDTTPKKNRRTDKNKRDAWEKLIDALSGNVNYEKKGIGQVKIEYTPKYDSWGWLGTLCMEISAGGVFSWKNGSMGSWNLTKQQEREYYEFFSNPQNLQDFFDNKKAYNTNLDKTNISHPTAYELQITWNDRVKKVSVGIPDIPFKHPFN